MADYQDEYFEEDVTGELRSARGEEEEEEEDEESQEEEEEQYEEEEEEHGESESNYRSRQAYGVLPSQSRDYGGQRRAEDGVYEYQQRGSPPRDGEYGGYSQDRRRDVVSEFSPNSTAYLANNQRGAPPPPSGQVSFGQGLPQEYSFQYSQCTGRRKALLIGINYFGQDGELKGCINDVNNVSEFLIQRFGYKSEDMVILTDDQRSSRGQPTKDNIMRAIQWLVGDAQPNDSLFFHYSGHGGQTKDLDGDELDGNDEVIYPVDYRQAGHIVDDDVHNIMVNSLPQGVRLTAIFDSCHSGTVLDLPYVYSTQGVLKEPNLAKEAGQGLLGAISSYSRGDLDGVASNVMGFFKKATTGNDAQEKSIATKFSHADVIAWSGSKDDQTSADATIASSATGAMSWAFIAAMKENSQQSYLQLLNSIRDKLEAQYSQKPQLSCSHPLDTNLLFIM